MNENFAVCFTADKKYLAHFCVACYSFLKNNAGQWSIYLLSDDVVDADLKLIRAMVHKASPNSLLHLIQVSEDKLQHLPLPHHSRIGLQTYYRLLLPELLPNIIHHVLYFDSDIVVQGLVEITQLNLGNHPIAGAKDPLDGKANVRRGIEGYYNAGVVLLNIENWRKENHMVGLLQYKPKIHRQADQDLLNEYFDGKWLEFSNQFNYPAFNLILGNKTKQGIQPAVIHFIGKWKPWNYWFKGSWLYWINLLKTPYWYIIIKLPFTMFNSLIYKLKK